MTRPHVQTGTTTEQALVRHLVAAWHAADVPAIVAVLTEDALLTMPPGPERYVGREAIRTFLATVPGGHRLDLYRLVPTPANRQPALAAYIREGDEGVYQAHAVMVLAIEGEAIASLARFAGRELFGRFGLPMTLDG